MATRLTVFVLLDIEMPHASVLRRPWPADLQALPVEARLARNANVWSDGRYPYSTEQVHDGALRLVKRGLEQFGSEVTPRLRAHGHDAVVAWRAGASSLGVGVCVDVPYCPRTPRGRLAEQVQYLGSRQDCGKPCFSTQLIYTGVEALATYAVQQTIEALVRHQRLNAGRPLVAPADFKAHWQAVRRQQRGLEVRLRNGGGAGCLSVQAEPIEDEA